MKKEDIKIYVTDAGLGYNQAAYLVRYKKSEIGFEYFVIDTTGISEDNEEYKIGNLIDLEDFYVTESSVKFDDINFGNNIYFRYFIENLFNSREELLQEAIDDVLEVLLDEAGITNIGWVKNRLLETRQ